ncbi:MAG: hypothetical protein WKF77_23100 [Planctomycetaceae bacterium]
MMRFRFFLALIFTLAASTAFGTEPLALNADNPHYFQFRGKPTILITSAEHYGAVLNTEFDYVRYLDELSSCGLNHTRLFSGVYVEPQGAFNIARNTLAPNPGMYLAPWARSDQPGYANGGNKFDLSKWDEAYFTRLKDFLTQAGHRGIVVEVNLFCPMYEDGQWKLSPMNAANNINGIGKCDKHAVFTLDKEPSLLTVQEQLVSKFVAELWEFDNLFYEICNEPYFGGVTRDWQHHIVDVIVAAEKDISPPHLIAMNIANGSQKIEHPHPAVSIFNFHYSYPPTAVFENYGLNKVIGENETGFKGTADAYYRHEAWEFLMAGGGLFNNLDYSFTVGHEDGTFAYPASQPGGGNRGYRQQLKVLKDFLYGFDFPRLKPDQSPLKNDLPKGVRMQMMTDGDRQYAMYLQGGQQVDLTLSLEAYDYRVQWIDVLTGNVVKEENRTHSGGTAVFASPAFTDDIALRIIAVDDK